MNGKHLWKIVIVLGGMILGSCHSSTENVLTDQEKKEGWRLLFDGKTLDGWHLYNDSMQTSQSVWKVKNQHLVWDSTENLERGDLVTNQVFTNYDLKFEWQLQAKGNSGVFINVLEQPDIATAWMSGPEYQLLDSAHIDFDKPVKRPGALFGFSAQKNPVGIKKVGAWNQSEIKQLNGKITFILNGVTTYEGDLNTPSWKDTIANTHFKEFPHFGNQISGKIGLQDWHSMVGFRNIKIKEL